MARNFRIDGYFLKGVSGACPESYDVYREGRHVGHLRQNAGHFAAEVHGVSSPGEVYAASTIGDGTFCDEERSRHLRGAVRAIHDILKDRGFFDVQAATEARGR